MSVRTQQQHARRRAREARTEQEKVRKARARRLEDLAVTVLTSIDAVAEHEQRAGEALRTMVEEEGLSLREAVSWCGDEVSVRTAARFKRLIAEASGERASAAEGPGDEVVESDDDQVRTAAAGDERASTSPPAAAE